MDDDWLKIGCGLFLLIAGIVLLVWGITTSADKEMLAAQTACEKREGKWLITGHSEGYPVYNCIGSDGKIR